MQPSTRPTPTAPPTNPRTDTRPPDARPARPVARKAAPPADPAGGEPGGKPNQASQLVALARERFDLVVSEDGRPYAVVTDGPNVVLPLRGKAGLRAQLARLFTDANGGSVPSQGSLSDAMMVLEGQAAATDPVEVSLRVAGGPERIVIDLGTANGRAVVITPGAWTVVDRSPVLFRRSGAMAPMPTPDRARTAEGLDALRALVNMDEPTFRQLVGWLVAAWMPHIPHPILTFKGEQGTGKSKAAQMIVNIIDPSPATRRTQPRDIKMWSTQAFNSWALCLDNISVIPPWLSDTLCKAVTGDGFVDRALYTDDDVVVLTFRRVLAMTTIDAGALAGDLAERLMILDLQLIDPTQRRTERALDAAFELARPAILAALLDLLAEVLTVLPGVALDSLPRMADFAQVLAALDQLQGWDTLADYGAAAAAVNADALEGDPFGSAVLTFTESYGPWSGTAGELLERLNLTATDSIYHPKWPKDATRASGQLKRLAPVLRSVGVLVDDTQRSADRHRRRLVALRLADQPHTIPEQGSGLETSGITASAAPTVSWPPVRKPGELRELPGR
ncbi:ATP-binding protein [Kitasatospora sp. NBC_00070]|uniref:ATP-binding protein n=1 Tax=Kitasatospora sp. NBC_00070 TaxID=2975962 RepID=UPI0032506D15